MPPYTEVHNHFNDKVETKTLNCNGGDVNNKNNTVAVPTRFHLYLVDKDESVKVIILFGNIHKQTWNFNTHGKEPDHTFEIQVGEKEAVYLLYVYDIDSWSIKKVTKNHDETTHIFTNKTSTLRTWWGTTVIATSDYQSNITGTWGDGRTYSIKGQLHLSGSLFGRYITVDKKSTYIYRSKGFNNTVKQLCGSLPQIGEYAIF